MFLSSVLKVIDVEVRAYNGLQPNIFKDRDFFALWHKVSDSDQTVRNMKCEGAFIEKTNSVVSEIPSDDHST